MFRIDNLDVLEAADSSGAPGLPLFDRRISPTTSTSSSGRSSGLDRGKTGRVCSDLSEESLELDRRLRLCTSWPSRSIRRRSDHEQPPKDLEAATSQVSGLERIAGAAGRAAGADDGQVGRRSPTAWVEGLRRPGR